MSKKSELKTVLQSKDPSTLNMVIGFDGFVDEIIQVVNKRLDSEKYTRIETINALAKRIEKASGLSTNIELVPTTKKIGGNGPIMCKALSYHNSNIAYLGALGVPNVHEVFTTLPDNVMLHSFANSGHTDALEFDDGKLMLGKMSSLKNVTYKNLVDTLGKEELIALLDSANLFASVNWSMLPDMTNLWNSLLEDILPHLNIRDVKPIMFVDLADPEKRENKEIKEALYLLKKFRTHFTVVLGLNKKEAYDVADVLGLFDHSSLEYMQVALEDLNEELQTHLGVDAVVIHPVDRSCVYMNQTFYEEDGPYIPKPKLTTGAGDNFNAGFVLGLLLGLSPDQSLLTGMATSGYYVRNAKSPTFKELISFLDDWDNDSLDI